MGTRVLILNNGKRWLVTHWDGYPETMQKTLRDMTVGMELKRKLAKVHKIDTDYTKGQLNGDFIEFIYDIRGRNDVWYTPVGFGVFSGAEQEKWGAMGTEMFGTKVLAYAGGRLARKMQPLFPFALVKSHVTRRGRIVRGHVRRKTGTARVLKSGYQRGRTTAHDKTLSAMLPGKRMSHTGNIYYEHRADRTDVVKEHGLKTRRFRKTR